MQGIVFNIQRFSINDGPGIRTTLFLQGCPLSCCWCHNPEGIAFNELSKNGKSTRKTWNVLELYEEINKDRIFYDESRGGVTFSGGEPLAQPEFLLEILQKCHAEGIHTTVDTSGFADLLTIKNILPFTDLFLFDLKLIEPDEHLKYTGKTNEIILSNLKFLAESNTNVIIRIPLINGITSTAENLKGILDLLTGFGKKLPIGFLKYHSMARGKYERLGIPFRLNDHPELSEAEFEKVRNLFVNSGFNVID
jgi:pyruvate formate lyase activating enzyme